MDSYCELKALPNPEIIQSAVIAELMQVLHKLLPACEGQIGLDFPAYGQHKRSVESYAYWGLKR